jgi:2',3'-cyclic-nucleotide 2'-phosphodiesterase (5'-nucleotidase family)
MASHLRLSENCDLVIAVTHMRLVEDLAVSGNTLCDDERVDLVLGGHDHHVVLRDLNNTNPDPEVIQSGIHDPGSEISHHEGHVRIVKSGTDWRGLSVVRLRLGKGNNGEKSVSTISGKRYTRMLPKTLHF